MDKGENSRLVESENENLEPQRRGYICVIRWQKGKKAEEKCHDETDEMTGEVKSEKG